MDARLRLIGFYEKRKEFTAARQCAEVRIAGRPQDLRLYSAISRVTDSGKVGEPNPVLPVARVIHRREPRIRWYQRVLRKGKKPGRAVSEFRKLISSDQESVLWKALGQAYHEDRQPKEVIACYDGSQS